MSHNIVNTAADAISLYSRFVHFFRNDNRHPASRVFAVDTPHHHVSAADWLAMLHHAADAALRVKTLLFWKHISIMAQKETTVD